MASGEETTTPWLTLTLIPEHVVLGTPCTLPPFLLLAAVLIGAPGSNGSLANMSADTKTRKMLFVVTPSP
jgi:hypothetical protein